MTFKYKKWGITHKELAYFQLILELEIENEDRYAIESCSGE